MFDTFFLFGATVLFGTAFFLDVVAFFLALLQPSPPPYDRFVLVASITVVGAVFFCANGARRCCDCGGYGGWYCVGIP